MLIEDLRGKHRGKCIVMGNGPSLIDHRRPNPDPALSPDLSQWNFPPVIGTNKSWTERDSDYHVLLDHAQWASYPGVWKVYEEHGKLITMGGPGIQLKPWHDGPFSWDLTQGVREGWPNTGGSVVLVALQVAAWLGFTEVFLLGCDLQGGKFYDENFAAERPEYPGILKKQVALFSLVAPYLAGKLTVWNCGARPASPSPFPAVPFEACLEG